MFYFTCDRSLIHLPIALHPSQHPLYIMHIVFKAFFLYLYCIFYHFSHNATYFIPTYWNCSRMNFSIWYFSVLAHYLSIAVHLNSGLHMPLPCGCYRSFIFALIIYQPISHAVYHVDAVDCIFAHVWTSRLQDKDIQWLKTCLLASQKSAYEENYSTPLYHRLCL